MSELPQERITEIRIGNRSVRDAMRIKSCTFYSNRELFVQEASYNVLQFAVSGSSDVSIFICTSPPGDRVRIVKPITELQSVDSASTEILVDGLIENYVQRPN
jgi:hypothetical protein